MIELLFVAQHYQCGAEGAPQEFIVQVSDGQTLTDITIGQSIVIPELESIGIIPSPDNTCKMNVFDQLEATENNIPDLPGLYDQPDIADYLEDLSGSESIMLYEFGSTSGPSADYQDVIIRIDWDYAQPPAD